MFKMYKKKKSDFLRWWWSCGGCPTDPKVGQEAREHCK